MPKRNGNGPQMLAGEAAQRLRQMMRASYMRPFATPKAPPPPEKPAPDSRKTPARRGKTPR